MTSTAALTSSSSDPARKALELRDHIVVFQRAISSLSHASQPVIVALHGMALGLGVDIASACDVRLAAHDTVFGILVRSLYRRMADGVGSECRLGS